MIIAVWKLFNQFPHRLPAFTEGFLQFVFFYDFVFQVISEKKILQSIWETLYMEIMVAVTNLGTKFAYFVSFRRKQKQESNFP